MYQPTQKRNGSYLDYDANKKNVYNTYSLVLPSGEVYQHRKDIPTAAENFCYAPGDEISYFDTPIGRIGIAMCWEMIRYQTVRRMLGKVDFVMAGSCWWDFCMEDSEALALHFAPYNAKLALEAPQTLARMLGVPVIHSTHKASFESLSLFDQHKICQRPIVGATQIVSGTGEVIKSLDETSPAGVITDKITCSSSFSDYWIPTLPAQLIQGFEALNASYKKVYLEQTLPQLLQ